MPCGVTAMHDVRELTAELAARRLQTTIDALAARHGGWTG